ncbi:UNVERIFIED_CONTAM: hypothetical protein FKN15_046436 [Acipenser sinensis]
MASSRAEKNWSELQESLNRVRQQRGVVPRTGWDSLLSSGNNLQPPVSASQRGQRQDCAAALYFTENKRFAWDCVNSFIADILSDELIPDLLIEVFSRDSVQQSSPVKLPSTDSVKKQRQSNAGHVQEHTSRLPSMLFGELLQEVMLDVSAEVLRSAVKGFVDSHMTKAAIYDSMSEIVTETVQDLIPGLVREVQAGLAVDSVLEEELLPEVVSRYAARRLMDSFLMDHLVALVENHGQSFVQKEQSRKLLDSNNQGFGAYLTLAEQHCSPDSIAQVNCSCHKFASCVTGWIVNTLFHQYHSVRRQRDATLENVLLRHHHQKVFTDVALDVILGELTASVDEDVEDLLEYERQMEGEGFTG